MIIETKHANVTSNISSENATKMTISTDGMEHIMNLLTNLYKDPELAVIREYFTNGLDAQAASGYTGPVEVTLPTWDAPTYIVKDRGIGMSEDDIRNIYAQYGASTKRDSNTQIGAFGLGCKSALTITQQFTLSSVKDGRKTAALISKTEEGINTVNILSNTESTEPSGTTVKIPINNSLREFREKAFQFFSFTTPGVVLVNGQPPANALEATTRVVNPNDESMEIFILKGGGYYSSRESYVIMGNVAYELSAGEIEKSVKRLGLNASNGFYNLPKYIPVPIGSVDLSPSREGIRFTEKTNNLIDSYVSFLISDLAKVAQDEIDACDTMEEIFDVVDKWSYIVDVQDVYKGKKFPRQIKITDAPVHTIHKTSWGSTNHGDSQWITLKRNAGTYTIVTGHKADEYKKVSRYIGSYMEAMDYGSHYFFITDSKEILDNEWALMCSDMVFVSGEHLIETAKEYRKQQREASGPKPKRDPKKLRYPVLNVADNTVKWIAYNEITEGLPYLNVTDFFGGLESDISKVYDVLDRDTALSSASIEYFKYITDENEIILLNAARTTEALEKRVKGVYNLYKKIEEKAEELSKTSITPALVQAEALSHSNWKFVMSKLSHTAFVVDDPTLNSVLNPPQAAKDAYDEYHKASSALRYFASYRVKQMQGIDWSDDTTAEELSEKYPLVGAISMYSLDTKGLSHFVKYLNDVHNNYYDVLEEDDEEYNAA